MVLLTDYNSTLFLIWKALWVSRFSNYQLQKSMLLKIKCCQVLIRLLIVFESITKFSFMGSDYFWVDGSGLVWCAVAGGEGPDGELRGPGRRPLQARPMQLRRDRGRPHAELPNHAQDGQPIPEHASQSNTSCRGKEFWMYAKSECF